MLYRYLDSSRARFPERPALRLGDETLSYAMLDERARRFAAMLGEYGVRPGARVALWAPKELDTFVALHGTLAAGLAYVPIDVAAPAKRACWIVDDSRSEALVCRAADYQAIASEVPASVKLVVLLDESVGHVEPSERAYAICAMADVTKHAPRDPAQCAGQGDDEALAYVLYTSGSTGVPKGVALSHRAGEAFVDWASECCELRPTDRVANHASLSFDLSVFDIFGAARAGACLCPVPSVTFAFGYAFAKFIEREAITVWYSVPTILVRVTEQQERQPRDLSSLRVVIFAGEPFPKADLKRFCAAVRGPILFNWYGPTETNVCTWYQVQARDLVHDAPLPIGWACPYSRMRVVAGEDGSGELHVSGASLLSGYLKAGGVESSVLVRHAECSETFYPTGDFVSQTPDGCFLYHGRRDHQLKRNGYRIEAREIEEVACAMPSIRDAAVVLGGGALILFCVAARACEPDVLGWLAARLPPYMLPDRVLKLSELPRTDRGKKDYVTLRAMAEAAHA